MDSNTERRKAIKLALFGSGIITIIIFLMGWATLFLIGIITPKSLPEDQLIDTKNQEEESTSAAGLEVVMQEYDVSSPYKFSGSVYALDPKSDIELSAEAVVFNTEVEKFIQSERNLFEDDLIFFMGSIDQPDSKLEIKAVGIKKSGLSIVITYDITTKISKDDGEVVVTKEQAISL